MLASLVKEISDDSSDFMLDSSSWQLFTERIKIRQEKIKDVFSGSNNLVPGEVLLCGRVRRVSF